MDDKVLRSPRQTRSKESKPAALPKSSVQDSTEGASSASVAKSEISPQEPTVKPGSSYPAVKASDIDVDAKPVYEPIGKPITEIDMDAGELACGLRTG